MTLRRIKVGAIHWLMAPAMTLSLGGAMSAALLLAGSVLWVPLLYATIGVAAWLGWRSTRWPDAWAKYCSFGAILLLVCVMQRALYLSDYLVSGTHFDQWPIYSVSPEWSMFKGEMITLIGLLFTVLGWRAGGGLRISPGVLLNHRGSNSRLLWVAYVMSLSGLVVAQSETELEAALGQALPTLMGLGLVVSFLIPVFRFRRPANRLVMVLVLSAPFIFVALGKGMKESLVLAFLPLAVLAWTLLRSPVLRGLMIVAGLALIGIITAYVQYYRVEVWYTKSDQPTAEVVRGFLDEAEANGLAGMAVDGVDAFLSRNNSSTYRGWAVSIADEQRHYPELVYGPVAYVFVPRVLWPEKPQIRQGWEYSGVVFGANYIASSESSTSAGLYTSFYLGAGWLGMLLSAFGIGLLLAACTRIMMRFSGPAATGLYMFSLVPYLIRLDEAWSVGALAAPVVSLAYLSILLFVARILTALTPGRRSAAQ